MNSRNKKFLSYYKPYLGLLVADLACAFVVAAVTLILPLGARYITKSILGSSTPNALDQIYIIGIGMCVLIIIHALCNMFVDYQGHMMGALMERDMRAELFAHYQKLSFRFYDDQKTGQLMNRITNDTFALGELYHHGPEDIVISFVKFFGTFFILITINVPLTLIVFAFLPLMASYAFYFNRKMNIALRASKDRIADINVQVEDTLAGIRVVKSFANGAIENKKFAAKNNQFVESKRAGHKSEAFFYNGIVAFIQLFTVVVIVFGGITIAGGSLDLADLVTYLLYVGLLIEPIRTALNFARLYQEGVTGFDRFMEMLEVEPDIREAANALELKHIQGNVEFEDVTFRYKEEPKSCFKKLIIEGESGRICCISRPFWSGQNNLMLTDSALL